MAGGEKAKSSGEYGEKIVKNLLEIFGWKDCISGVTVPCVHQDTHKKQNAISQKNMGLIMFLSISHLLGIQHDTMF